MRYLLCLLFFSFSFTVADQPAYQLYGPQGKQTRYARLLEQAAGADVVLFGELHNNPICHWLELQLTKDLYARKQNKLILGAEMFEADNQRALSLYVEGATSDSEFAQQARLWPNYSTDYKPIVQFARTSKIPFVASNVPRRYASLVARKGLAALDTVAEKKWIAPLPIRVDLTLPGYRGMLDMMKEHSGGPGTEAANFARAQAIKDATMAHFILQNWQPDKTLLHLNGDYHSKNFEGISWYLHQQRPALRILTISSVEQTTVNRLAPENKQTANFVLVIPADMTKTY